MDDRDASDSDDRLGDADRQPQRLRARVRTHARTQVKVVRREMPPCANICSSPSAIIPNTLLVETPEDTPEDDVCHLPSHMMNGVPYVVEYSLV